MSSAPERPPPTVTVAATMPPLQDASSPAHAPAPPQRSWWLGVAALVIGYAVLSHYSASSPDAKGLGAALSLGPLLLIGVFLVWRWTHPAAAILTAGVLGAIMYRYWGVLEENYEWVDLAQQCGVYALVAASFAGSLFGGRVPLCTQLALQMHGNLTPAEMTYTRGATWAWASFYIVLALAILVLFFEAPLRIWSLFVNFATFGLIIIMGVADHAIRRRVIPRASDGGLLGIIRRAIVG